MGSQVQPPKLSENDHQSTGPSTASMTNPSGQRTRARRERRRAVPGGEISDAAEVAKMDVQEMEKSKNPQLDPVDPNQDSKQSTASKSNVEEVKTLETSTEPSCMEDIPFKKRRFTPLRPGTKTARSKPVISNGPQAFNPSPSRQCRHTNVSKKGCAMVCENCGEEVLYDGWKLELCDEFDV